MAKMKSSRWIPFASFAFAIFMAICAGPTLGQLSGRLSMGPTGTPCDCNSNPQKPGTMYGPGELSDQNCKKTAQPIRYSSGENMYSAVELPAGGAIPWTQSRSYVSDPTYADTFILGGNWRLSQVAQLVQQGGNQIVMLGGSTPIRSFTDNGNGTYTTNFFYLESLVKDPSQPVLYVIDQDGSFWEFNDFSGTFGPPGTLRNYFDPTNTNEVNLIYGSSGGARNALIEIDFLGGADQKRYLYNYAASGQFTGALINIQHQVQISSSWTTIRQVNYQYYATTGPNSPAGQLERAQVCDGSGNILDTRYYRYNALDGSGFATLRFALEPTAYARASAPVASGGLGGDAGVDSALDSQLAPYASYYFEYDSTRRVTKEIAQGQGCSCSSSPGGTGIYTYQYVLSTNAQTIGQNIWYKKTIETLPDTNQNIIYTNYLGQTLLEVFKDVTSGQQWLTFFQMDVLGRLNYKALPSSVTGYLETNPTLVLGTNINSTGLIGTWDYYATTNLGTGAVAGYLQDVKIQKGSSGTPSLQRTVTYTSHNIPNSIVPGGSTTTFPRLTNTIYTNTDGTGPLTTQFGYTWGGQGSGQVPVVFSITYPTVSTANNGSGAPTTVSSFYDSNGRITWIRDEETYLTNLSYDSVSGALTQEITDVNTSTLPAPQGWVTPAGGGLHLTSSYQVDGLGRTTKAVDPMGNVTYTIFQDTAYTKRIYPGWTGSATTGPTILTRQDRVSSYRERLTMSAPPQVSGGIPTGGEGVSNLQSLSRDYLDNGDRISYTDDYFNFQGLTYAVTPNIGIQGQNFYRKTLGYDLKGRQDRKVDWTGTIVRRFYDSRDRTLSTWIGTNDTPASGIWSPTNNTAPSNMIKYSAFVYDGGIPGDGTLTKSSVFTSPSVSMDTLLTYDYRSQLIQSQGPDLVIQVLTLDNLGQQTMQQTYANGVVSAANLRAMSSAAFDAKCQIFQRTTTNVNPSNGTVGDTLTANYWFNPRGMLVKSRGPNGDFSKSSFDGARRMTGTFASYDSAETLYADALTVAGDTVVEQKIFVYDKNGNEIEIDDYRRCSASTKTGDLSVSWSVNDSRRMFSASWFDPANRLMSSANYGTNSGNSFTRPTSPPAPNSSDTVLVTKYGYDNGGHKSQVTDNLNRLTQFTFDGLGRKTQSVDNFVTGAPTETSLDTDRTLTLVYDSLGRASKFTALNPKGSGQGVQSQITTFVFGTTANQAAPPSFRNDVLTAVIFPDSDDTYNPNGPPGGQLANGTDGVFDRREMTYDYTGRRSSLKDQRGVVHTYTYDSSGRLSADTLTTPLPAGVDASILRLGQTYDSISRPAAYSSYSDVAGSQVANQVAYTYDGWGHAIKTEQSHVGAVVSGSSPAYQTAYVDGATSSPGPGKYLRPSSMTYPNGRIVYLNYPAAPSTGDTFSRIDNIADDSAGTIQLAQYSFIGGSTVLDINHNAVTGGLVYRQGPENNPGGWDLFDRQIMVKWRNSALSNTQIEWDYTFDRASDLLTRKRTSSIAPPKPMDEAYTVDGLSRVTKVNRGALSGTPPTISDASANFSQKWPQLESAGNWRQFQIAPSGANNFTFQQTRVHNSANEIDTDNNDADAAGSSITGSGGAAWIAPTADKAGNLKSGPQVGAEGTRQWFTYDGWSRLVKIQADNAGVPGAEISEYQYDGYGRRTAKLLPNGSNWNRTDYYYTHEWQCIEERTLANTNKTTVATVPHFQWVYDLRYMDAVVLRDENKNGDSTCNGSGDQRLFYCHDSNANTIALVNTSGAVVERYVYTPYGNATILDGNWNSQAATVYNNEIQFTGYRVDPESGLHHVRHRQYHSTLGRWMQRDPKGYHDSANLYEYIASRPLDQRDPMGTGAFHAEVPTEVREGQHWAWNTGVTPIATFTYSAKFSCHGEGDDLHVEEDSRVIHENNFKGIKHTWELGPVKAGWHFEVKDDGGWLDQGKCKGIWISGEVTETSVFGVTLELPGMGGGGEGGKEGGGFGLGWEGEGETGKLTFDATFQVCCCCAMDYYTKQDVYDYSIMLIEKHANKGILGKTTVMTVGKDNWANIHKCFEKTTKPKIYGPGAAPVTPMKDPPHETWNKEE